MTNRKKLPRRLVYAGTIIAMLAMAGGFAMATFSQAGSSGNQQGSQVVTITNGVAGVNTPGAIMNFTNGTSAIPTSTYTFASASTGCTGTAATSGAPGTAYCIICHPPSGGSCATNDVAEVIILPISGAFTGPTNTVTFHITVSATADGGSISFSVSNADAAVMHSTGDIYVLYDLGPTGQTVTNVFVSAASS